MVRKILIMLNFVTHLPLRHVSKDYFASIISGREVK